MLNLERTEDSRNVLLTFPAPCDTPTWSDTERFWRRSRCCAWTSPLGRSLSAIQFATGRRQSGFREHRLVLLKRRFQDPITCGIENLLGMLEHLLT